SWRDLAAAEALTKRSTGGVRPVLVDFMMIVGARQAPYQTRVGGKCGKKFMLSSGGASGIRDPSQDLVVRRGDLEYQRRMQPQALQSIALAVAEARSVNLVLQRIVEGLAGQPGTALARIWLRGPRRSLLVILPRPSRVPRPEAMPALTGER